MPHDRRNAGAGARGARSRSLFGATGVMLTLAAVVLATGGLAAGAHLGGASATADVGYRDFAFGTAAAAPTAKEPQSKLWFNDGLWWGAMFNKTSKRFEIYRLDWATQTWTTTGTTVDTRPKARVDAFWDGSHLYTAAAGQGETVAGDSGSFRRFSYSAATKSYTQDSGYPVTMTNAGAQAVVIDKDTTGKIWATFTQQSKVWVTHTSGDDRTWVAPFVLPATGSTGLLSQDESTLVAYNGHIGVLWGDQATDPMTYYFAIHTDGDADTVWQSTIALQGAELADNHIDIKSIPNDPAGQVFAAVKTSLNAPNDPLNYLLVLGQDGVWRRHVVGTVADDHTRAIVLIDQTDRQLYWLAASPCCNGGAIYYKQSSLDNISFTSGLGTPFIRTATDVNINNPTSTKQTLSPQTGLVAIASDDKTRFYLHNAFGLGSNDTTPPDTTIDSGPTGVVTTPEASFTFSSNENPVTFQCSLDGGTFTACTSPKTYSGVADGQHTVQVRAIDAAGNIDPTPALRAWTVDTTATTLTVSSDADARVEEQNPSTNFGTATALVADLSPNIESFLRFPVSGLSGTIVSAKLRLHVSDGTIDGPGVYPAANTWTETGVTWNTRPAVTGALLDNVGTLAIGTLDYDVSAAVTANGTYTFKLQADSGDGTTISSRESTVVSDRPQLVILYHPDTTPPDTSIVSGPSGPTGSASASFAFTASEPGSTFECRLDGGAFAACTSPQGYSGLSQGAHTFDVRAIDPAGNADPTPASQSWIVDTVAPAAPSITSPLDGATVTSASLTVSGSAEANASVELLDGATSLGSTSADETGAWSKSVSGLGEGSHTFTAKATDAAGNASAASSAVRITVDAVAPQTAIDSGPSGATSSTSASFAFSSDEAVSTFQCSLDSAPFAGCTSPTSYSGLAQGTHTFQVRATDVAGNTDQTPAARSWTVDTVAPPAPAITSPSDGSSTASSSFTVSGTAEANATVELFDSATSLGSTAADGAGAWSRPATGLADGQHALTATATDAAGNTSSASTVVHVTVDAAAPETTIDSGPSGPTSSTSASFAFSADDAGATFECSLEGAPFAACTSPKGYTGLAEGAHSFQVRARDAVGNVDPTPASRSWTVDTAPPTVSSVSPASGAFGVQTSTDVRATFSEAMDAASIGGTTFVLAASGLGVPVAATVSYDAATRTATLDPNESLTPATTYTATLRGGTGGVADAGGNVLAADYTWSFTTDVAPDTTPPETSIDSGPSGPTASTEASFAFSADETGSTFACSLDGAAFASCSSPKGYTGLGQGPHSFAVRATDRAGNTDQTPATRSWTVDTVAPGAPAITAPSNGSMITTSSLTVSGTAEANSTVELFDGPASLGTTSANAGGAWSEPVSGLADGQHSFTARATDAAGNTSAGSSAVAVTVDTGAPETSIASGPTGPTSSSAASFGFSADDPAATFECSLDGAPFAACTSPKAYSGLAEGAHTFQVRAKDTAGNVDQTPAARSWTVDTVAPAAPAITNPADGSTSTSSSLTISGTAEPNATVEVFDGAASLGSTTADGSGAWSRTVSGLSDGQHSLTAKATDAAGNGSPASAAVHVTVDATAPETTIDSGPSGTTSSTSATFAFSSNDAGATFACSLDDGAFTACTSPKSYSGLAEGAHTFLVRASDQLGNTDPTPASRSWTISLSVFSDGFESGNFSAWNVVTGGDGTAAVQSSIVKTGAFAARLTESANLDSVAYARKSLGSLTDVRVSGDFQILTEGASGGNIPMLRLFDAAGNRMVSLYRQNASGDKVQVGYGGSNFVTTGRLPLNTWGNLELHVIVAGAGTSTVEVRLNGSLVYQSSSANVGTAAVATLQIGNDTKRQTSDLVADNIAARVPGSS